MTSAFEHSWVWKFSFTVLNWSIFNMSHLFWLYNLPSSGPIFITPDEGSCREVETSWDGLLLVVSNLTSRATIYSSCHTALRVTTHTLHQRYGQRSKRRSLEGKEHKLVRFKQHRVFNLRCLKENIVPKSVKINFKQFKPLNERKILCKTHRQILNSRVRKTNKAIDKFNKDIEL